MSWRAPFRRITKLFQSNNIILMYHRVHEASPDPWNLSVSPQYFDAQMEVLQQSKRCITLASLVDGIQSGDKVHGKIVVTFDDGYLDNYTHARPILEKYNIPATFFICTLNLNTNRQFWWDELSEILLKKRHLPQKLDITFRDLKINVDLDTEAVMPPSLASSIQQWNYLHGPINKRTKAYLKIWELLSPKPIEDQMEIMNMIRDWAEVSINDSHKNQSMTYQQIKDLSNNPLFSLGCHTHSHPDLTKLDQDKMLSDIMQNRSFLENLINTDMSFFAYPSGRYNAQTMAILENQHFQGAVTTQHVPISQNVNPLTMGRFQVDDWDKMKFKKWLKRVS